MKALVNPEETVSYISSWQEMNGNYTPVYTPCGVRIVEVCEQAFDVAPPLFFSDCSDEVVADIYCYQDGVIVKKPDNAPKPEPGIPVTIA